MREGRPRPGTQQDERLGHGHGPFRSNRQGVGGDPGMCQGHSQQQQPQQCLWMVHREPTQESWSIHLPDGPLVVVVVAMALVVVAFLADLALLVLLLVAVLVLGVVLVLVVAVVVFAGVLR